jgi:hypothetical protein
MSLVLPSTPHLSPPPALLLLLGPRPSPSSSSLLLPPPSSFLLLLLLHLLFLLTFLARGPAAGPTGTRASRGPSGTGTRIGPPTQPCAGRAARLRPRAPLSVYGCVRRSALHGTVSVLYGRSEARCRRLVARAAAAPLSARATQAEPPQVEAQWPLYLRPQVPPVPQAPSTPSSGSRTQRRQAWASGAWHRRDAYHRDRRGASIGVGHRGGT